jgi:hypothetical protein
MEKESKEIFLSSAYKPFFYKGLGLISLVEIAETLFSPSTVTYSSRLLSFFS